MSRYDFHQLLVRYLAGKCNAEEQEWVDGWYRSLNKEFRIDEGSIDLDALEKVLWERVNSQTQSFEPPIRSFRKKTNFPKIWLVAASCGVLLLSTLWFIQKRSYPTEATFFTAVSNENITTIRNDTDSLKVLVLPDRSTIKLYPGASVQYASTFTNNREVHVSGDAYFDVKEYPNAPFIVFHETTITRVLGTAFLIRNVPGEKAEEITVFSGKVEVINNSGRHNVLKRILSKPTKVQISTNHRAILDEVRGRLEERIAANPLPLPSAALKGTPLHFSAVTLPYLARKLETIYGVSIEIDPSLNATTFTGEIDDMHLFEQLHLICEVTQTRYKIDGKKILIKK